MRVTSKTQGIYLARIVSLLLRPPPECPPETKTSNGYTFKTIAKTGQSEDHVTFGPYFQPGGINNWGEISFAPSVQPAGESVFLATGQNLKSSVPPETLCPEVQPSGTPWGLLR